MSEFSQSRRDVPQKQEQIRIAKSAYRKMLFQKITRAFTWGFFSVFIVYVCFAITILRVVPTQEVGFIPIKNNTFEGGLYPKDQVVLASLKSKQGDGFIERLNQSFTINKNVVIVKIVTGPYGEITWAEPGIITVDGEPVDAKMSKDPEFDFLENQYVAICIEGSCIKNEAIIIKEENIFGISLKKY